MRIEVTYVFLSEENHIFQNNNLDHNVTVYDPKYIHSSKYFELA